jgi:hypothetical protein
MRPDREGVQHAYTFFLGRAPDSELEIEQKLKLSPADFFQSFLKSHEFEQRVHNKVVARVRPAGPAYDDPPALPLRTWVAQVLPLTETARPRVLQANSWPSLLHMVFSDADFQLLVGSHNPLVLESEFIEGLCELSGQARPRPSAQVASTRPEENAARDPAASDISWVLISGAPRSGTSLLRAMLMDHPHVALLQEYGLTRLVDAIDTIVGRPKPLEEDWDGDIDAQDEAFARTVAFYRDRQSRFAVTRGGGDLHNEHFDAVARGIFQALKPASALRIVGDKMPMRGEWEDISRLMQRLPWFRILIVVRNPAEVVKSSLIRREAARRGRDAWPIATVQEAVREWCLAFARAHALKVRYGGVVSIVKYEDLCADPHATVAQIYAWLGLAPHEPRIPIEQLPAGLLLHSAAEDAVLLTLLGPVINAWPTMNASDLMERFAGIKPPYVFGETVDAGASGSDCYFANGFSEAQPPGRWICSPSAKMLIEHGELFALLLVEVWLSCAQASLGDEAEIVVRTGWGEPKLFAIRPERTRISFAAIAEEALQRGTLSVDIAVARPSIGGAAGLPRCDIAVEAFRITRLDAG